YDQAPEAKTTVQPKYPDIATRAGMEGTVWTKVSIDEAGKVTNVTISKSDAEIFNQVSIDAAMQWVFKPALKDGKPIATEVAIPFLFKMADKQIEKRSGKLAGSVSDRDSGQPIPEATVVVVGTTLVSLTNGSGKYAISGVQEGAHCPG
ncbi:MAG: TonB family protein, partial [Bacteroidetes bacterium]|nr:TonB family protein [Bacteroidota bacterium]